MTKYKFIQKIRKLNFSKNTKRNALNNSTSALLQPTPSTNNHNSKVQMKKTKASFVMAFKKLRHCLIVKNIQHVVAISIALLAILDLSSADAREFQHNHDTTTNIITDPKSAASIDFR